MKIVKNYGRSFTQTNNAGSQRKLRRDATALDIQAFANTHPELIIAQWISLLDKIYKKPKNNERPTQELFFRRNELANACWNNHLSHKFNHINEKDKLKQIWDAKVHPYPYQKKNEKGEWENHFLSEKSKYSQYKGRLYNRFIENEKDVKRIAFAMNQYLNENYGFNARQKKQGKINSRAISIEKNTLANHFANLMDETHPQNIKKRLQQNEICAAWNKADEVKFRQSAPQIALTIFNDVNDDKRNQKNQKPNWSDIAKHITEDYGQFFGDAGNCPSRKEIKEIGRGGELAIYDAVRAYYRNIFKRSKKVRAGTGYNLYLPKNNDELLRKLKQRYDNALVNDLIRIGRVIYYEDQNLTVKNKVPRFNADKEDLIQTSSYWESAGQAKIKRNEAFIRVWRNSITIAGRSLVNLTDPNETRSIKDKEDIFSGKSIEKLKDAAETEKEMFDADHARKMLPIIFGTHANLFEDDVKNTCLGLLQFGAETRNKIFHFRTIDDLINNIENRGSVPKEIKPKFKALLEADIVARSERIYDECMSMKMHHFVPEHQINLFIKTIINSDISELILPNFNKVLKTAHNLQKFEDEYAQKKGIEIKYSHIKSSLLELPEPANESRLNDPKSLVCFSALKMLYEKPFRSWLEKQAASQMQIWHKQVANMANNRAKMWGTLENNINSDQVKQIQSKISQASLSEAGSFIDLVAQMQHLASSEMRDQNIYANNPEAARHGMKWISDYINDFIAQAFMHFMADENGGKQHNWLMQPDKLSETSNAEMADKSKLSQAEKDNQLKEAWHANLYVFLHLIPANDVSLLLHQVRKWLVLEKKGEAGADAIKYADKIKQLIAVMELYIDMADANFTGQEEKHAFEGVQDLYEPAAFEKMMQNQNSTHDQMQLEFVRRGLRKMHRFGHLPFVKDLMGHEQKITEQQVTDYIHKKENHIEGWLQKREAIKECAIEAQKLSYEKCFEKFSEEDFNTYKQLIADITNYNFEAERIRLITHIKAYDKTLLLIGKLVDMAGIWERDHFFMLLAIMYIFKIEPITFFAVKDEVKNQADEFLKKHKYDDFSGESNGDLQQVYSICKKLGLLGEQYKKSQKNRNDIAHFNILASGASGLNITDQINAAREMMAYDRKMKNAVSKSIKDLMEREGVLLTWKTEEKGHNLKISKVHAKEIYHLKAWLEKHKQWRKFEDKKDVEAKYDKSQYNKEKRTRSIARNKEYERGGHYCVKEKLQSDDLIQAIKKVF